MKAHNTPKTCGTAIALLLALSGATHAFAQTGTPTKPDNSKVNQRDRNPGEVTADQQKMNAADRDLTAKIRRSVMADKTLSTYAHNVKIVAQNGTVTLKGPVRSDNEIKTILAMATDAAGSSDKVTNEMTIQPPKN